MTLRIYPYKWKEVTLSYSESGNYLYINATPTLESGEKAVYDAMSGINTSMRYVQLSFTGSILIQIKTMSGSNWVTVRAYSDAPITPQNILGIGEGIGYNLRIPASEYDLTSIMGVYSN